jgi:luciferase family oxidoreductase group 1
MLPHYSPFKVAELFSTLEALYPGRIDLGIGRAPGGSPLETLALRRERTKTPFPDDFPEQLVELLAYFEKSFDPGHPFSRIVISPAAAGAPEVWLLGSSMWSSAAAAHVGLPYAFAHFIDPRSTREAIESYRLNFESLQKGREPRVALAVGAICAETDAEARRLSQSVRLFRRVLLEGRRIGPIPTPEEAAAALGAESSSAPSSARGEWPRVVVGSPESVRETLATMSRELKVDELMLVTVVHDHAARVRSYELLADAFDLTPRALDREPARVAGS